MTVLIDTNVLARLANPGHPQYGVAIDALVDVRRRGYRPALVPQVLYEFWVIATRPDIENGLGMSVEQAGADVEKCLQKFDLFRDERAIFDRWHQIVVQHTVIGKTGHDARLVAAMDRHGINRLLTFNEQHFRRFPDITVIHPERTAELPALS